MAKRAKREADPPDEDSPETGPETGPIIVDREYARAVLGISQGRFAQFFKEGVFDPAAKVGRSRYDLPLMVRGLLKYYEGGRIRGGESVAEEKRKLVVAQRQRIEQEVMERRKELVPRSDAEQAFASAMVMVATQLDGLPGRVAGELASMTEPAEVRATLFEETRRIRDATATKLRDWTDHTTRRRSARPTPGKDG